MNLFVDKVLRLGFNATIDTYLAFMTPELFKRFPKAKVILAERNVDEWSRSMHDVFARLGGLASFPFNIELHWVRLSYLKYANVSVDPVFCDENNFLSKIPWINYCVQGVRFSPSEKEMFFNHNKKMKELIPKDQLMVFTIQDKWAPWFRFFNVPSSSPLNQVPFPELNSNRELLMMEKILTFVLVMWPFLFAFFAYFIWKKLVVKAVLMFHHS